MNPVTNWKNSFESRKGSTSRSSSLSQEQAHCAWRLCMRSEHRKIEKAPMIQTIIPQCSLQIIFLLYLSTTIRLLAVIKNWNYFQKKNWCHYKKWCIKNVTENICKNMSEKQWLPAMMQNQYSTNSKAETKVSFSRYWWRKDITNQTQCEPYVSRPKKRNFNDHKLAYITPFDIQCNLTHVGQKNWIWT